MGSYALLLGVSRFLDPRLARLSAPESDVSSLAEVLGHPARGGFDEVIISLDEELPLIRDKLAALFEGRRPKDMVLFYYSGHGIVDAANHLFLATGASMEDRPRALSLAASEIREMMEGSRAGRLIVILDCCHSGAFADGVKGNDHPVDEGTFSAGDGAEGRSVRIDGN